MAFTTIDDPEAFFQCKIYTGNGGSQSITFDGDTNLQPNFIWTKVRSETGSHRWVDTVKGIGKAIFSNGADQEASESNYASFDSDGFSFSAAGNINENTRTYVSWAWKGETTSGLSGGNITPSTYNYNATSGFGIYKYTGNGSTDQTIPHGLGSKPQLIFYKRLDSGTNWVAQSNLLGNRVQLVVNGTDAQNTDSRLGASDSWDGTNFNVGTYGDLNNSGSSHIAYVWCDVQGYQKVGTYTGTADNDGVFIYTGFEPAFVMTKQYNGGNYWHIIDNKRNPRNVRTTNLKMGANAADETPSGGENSMDFLSNGFKFRDSDHNNQNHNYLYIAIAHQPLVNSNGVPGNAV